MTAPLANHVLFQSDDLDCARERVAQKFCSHRLEIVGSATAFRAAHHHRMGEMISLNYISYGADVRIDPGALDTFYLIQIPIAGAATIRNGTAEFITDGDTASILNADRTSVMHWWRGCEQVLVQIRKAPFLHFVERLIERDLPGPLVFDPRIDMRRPEMRAWRQLLNALFCAADARDRDTGRGLWEAFNEQRLMESFVRAQPSNVSLFLPRREVPAPRHVKRAEAYIRAHADRPLTIGDIAEAAGVGPRALQLAYKVTFGISPMQALRRERLRRVQYELLEKGPDLSVTEAAGRWGFGHLGRFSAEYRRTFGELPRETARRSPH